jgi:hypothetical protein
MRRFPVRTYAGKKVASLEIFGNGKLAVLFLRPFSVTKVVGHFWTFFQKWK